jgi:hypothetical protein
MRTTIALSGAWEPRRLGGGWEYAQAFETGAEFLLGGACVEFHDLAAGATVLVNGVELGSASGSPLDRVEARDAIHAGRNEVTVRIARETAPPEVCREARVVSYDRVSISGFTIDPEIVGSVANVWITIDVANHTDEDQPVLASIVVAQGENREKVEVAEVVPPSGGEIDAVVRIVDPGMWEPSESGERPSFDCLIGLQVEGEVMDVAGATFEVGL